MFLTADQYGNIMLFDSRKPTQGETKSEMRFRLVKQSVFTEPRG
jgi:hypothetical protein